MDGNIFLGPINRILHLMARFGPGATTLRPFLHKLRGIKIGDDVFIGDDVYLENEYPHHIEIESGVRITLRSTLVAHARGVGRLHLKKYCYIGPSTTIVTGANETRIIGEHSVVAGCSYVNKNIPANIFAGGVPVKPIARATIQTKLNLPWEEWRKGLEPLDDEAMNLWKKANK